MSSPFTPAGLRWQVGFEHAGSILRQTHGDLVVSKQKLEQTRAIELIRLRRDQRDQELCFSSRPFVLCGLPARQLPKGQLLYERRNGKFVLQVAGHPDYGVPFGQDRVVPIFLATMAVRQRSQIIRFRSAAEMLDTFGMAKGGKEYRRLIAAFERIFGATMFFGTDTLAAKAKVVHRARFSFLQEARIWYQRSTEQRIPPEHCENVVVLSEEFYQEIIAHPIPADLEAVKLLSGAPAVLDLFVWLSYRCFVAKGPESIPLFGEFGLANQLGTVDYSRPRRFRQMLAQWLRKIRAIWPECPARISSHGGSLRIDHATAVQTSSGLQP